MIQRPTQISEEHKASLAAMTDTEFRRWLYERIDFLASHIDPRASMVSSRIVEVMDACDGMTISTASRFYLAGEHYKLQSYRRLFVETEEVVA